MNKEKLQVEVHCSHSGMVDLSSLVPNPKNPNKHDEKQIQMLAKLILAHGWRVPIAVSKRSGFIVRGHGRYEAALFLGLDQVPVDYQDYKDEAAEIADLIADNKVGWMSGFDEEELAALIKSIDADFDPELMAMTEKEFTELFATTAAGEVIDDDFDLEQAIDELEKAPIVKPGDLWQLGNHRLLCGDSTDPEVMTRLVGDQKVSMIFTDPPYNVNYEGSDGKKIENDHMSADKFNDFLFQAFSRMFEVCIPGAPIYVCHADSEGSNFRGALTAAGWLLKQCLIWEKNSFVLSRQDYHWKHEPILYGWKPGAAHKFFGKRKQSTVINCMDGVAVQKLDNDEGFVLTINLGVQSVAVKVPSYEVVADSDFSSIWREDKPLRNADHPTMKPIPLCAKAIRNSSKIGDIVLDSFGGSGSTLMACEQTNRKCVTTELDPVYASVIVRRWEQFTGEKAIIALS